MLYFSDGRPFSQGALKYSYRPATQWEHTSRVFIPIQIEGFATEAAIDTGGVYLICDPEIAEFIGLDPRDRLHDTDVKIRGVTWRGDIYRASLTLVATQGEGLVVEATLFVPRPMPYQQWDLPPVIGLYGCLERLRFAIDPGTDTFYFGAIDT